MAVATAGLGLGLAVLGRAEAAPQPQILPITAQWCLPQTSMPASRRTPVCIGLEVADEPHEQFTGMQHRKTLPPLQGMWFLFSSPTPAKFWMHLTPVPLDMIFVSNQQVVAVVANASPCMHLPCRRYGTDIPVDSVVELASGEAARLGITVGSQAVILPLATPLPASNR